MSENIEKMMQQIDAQIRSDLRQQGWTEERINTFLEEERIKLAEKNTSASDQDDMQELKMMLEDLEKKTFSTLKENNLTIEDLQKIASDRPELADLLAILSEKTAGDILQREKQTVTKTEKEVAQESSEKFQASSQE